MPLSRFALTLTITSTIRSTAPPPPNSTLFRLDMTAQSSRLTQAAADGGFQQRQGLVVVVCRVHGVALGAQRGDLRVQQLEKCARADTVALRRQLQLLTGSAPIRILQADRPERGLQRQERLAYLRLYGQAARPHRFLEVAVLRACIGDTQLTPKVVKDRQRHGQTGLEWLPGELEWEDGILVAQRLLISRAPDKATTVVGWQSCVGANSVVILALGVLARVRRLRVEDQGIAVRELLREARPPRRQG